MVYFVCPDCGWEGEEDKPPIGVPCPHCGQPAMPLDLPEDVGREGDDSSDPSGLGVVESLEDLVESENENEDDEAL